MRSVTPMRTAKTGYVVVSILLCVFGFLLIIFPNISAELLGMVCGILMILFGGFKLVGYFSKDLYRLAFQYDLAFGVLVISLGVIMLVHPGTLAGFISVALGIAILADGLFKIQIASDAKSFGLGKWWVIFAMAVVTVILGIILVFRPTESAVALTVLLGISLLAEGVLNLGTALTAVKIIRHQQPDTAEDPETKNYYTK